MFGGILGRSFVRPVPTGRRSQSIQLRDGTLIADIACVERGFRLQQEHVRLDLRDGAMLDAARDDEELARVEDDIAVAEAHGPDP